jgi:hypothetical protein
MRARQIGPDRLFRCQQEAADQESNKKPEPTSKPQSTLSRSPRVAELTYRPCVNNAGSRVTAVLASADIWRLR